MNDRIERARQLGREEAAKGGSVVPALCPALMELLEGLPVGSGALMIMQAFQQAFIEAPLPGAKQQRVELLETLEIISRGACLEQMNGDRCGCYPCIARAAIAKATDPSESPTAPAYFGAWPED